MFSQCKHVPTFLKITEDAKSTYRPEDFLNLFAQSPPGVAPDVLEGVLPSLAYLDGTLQSLSPDVIDPSIAVLDPLIPVISTANRRGKTQKPLATDRYGFSAYARSVSAHLRALGEDRQLARRNLWVLRHFFALSVYAQDILDIPSAIARSPAFDDKVNPAALADIVARSRQISVYLLNTAAVQDDDTWRMVVLDRLLTETVQKDPREGLQQLQMFLYDAIVHAKNGDGLRDARVLKMVLDPLFQDGLNADEGELWVQYARKVEKTGLCLHIFINALLTGRKFSSANLYDNHLGRYPQRCRAAQARQISKRTRGQYPRY